MAQKIATVEGITEYQLQNGLKVLLFPDAGQATSTVCMTYLVGSRHENYGETGMAHLLEHLMFKGSKHFPNPINEFARRGFRHNGTTGLDRTNYFVTFTANEDNLQWSLAWMADAMVNSHIAQSDLDTEMTVVRNEFEMGENDPHKVLFRRIRSVAFDCHNYGHATIGAKSDIENVTIENLQAFYRRYYQPDNAVLTVAGHFDPNTTLERIETLFGGIPKPDRTLPAEWTKETPADGPRYFEIRRKGESKVIMTAYRIPSALHPDALGVSLCAKVFGATPGGRLYEKLVKSGLATSVAAYPHLAVAPNLLFVEVVIPKDGDEKKALDVLVETLESSLDESPVTRDELALALSEYKMFFERLYADSAAFATGISNFVGLGDWRLFFVQRDELDHYTPETVTQAWRAYCVRDNRIVGIFIPDEAPKRAVIPIASAVKDIVNSHAFNEIGRQGQAFDASPDNINRRTERLTVGELNFALLPKNSRGETVVVRTRFRYGNPQSLRSSQVLKSLTKRMLTRGTSTKSRKDIADAFKTLKINGTIGWFTTTRDNLMPALRLMGELWRDSAFDIEEFEELRNVFANKIQASLDDPLTLAGDALIEHFNTYGKDDPRYPLSNREALAALRDVKSDEVKRFYREQFGTMRGEVVIVGDFDAEALRLELPMIFDKPSRVTYERMPSSEYRPVKAKRIVIDTPDKENAILMARVDFAGCLDDEDAMALSIANRLFGSRDNPSNRLRKRLREQDGLSYSVGATLQLPSKGNRASWSLLVNVAPQNMAKAQAALFEEIERVLTDGFTQEELADAERGFLDLGAVRRNKDTEIAERWIELIKTKRDWTEESINEDRVRALTLEDVNAAFKKMVNPDNLTVVLAGDQSKAGIN